MRFESPPLRQTFKLMILNSLQLRIFASTIFQPSRFKVPVPALHRNVLPVPGRWTRVRPMAIGKARQSLCGCLRLPGATHGTH
jgi:hypothetical protein